MKNTGTKIRTIFFAVACVNQAVASVGDVDFGSHAVNVAYKVLSTALTIIAGSFALYYNNDFTEEGAVGTMITREMKALRDVEIKTVEEPEDSIAEESVEDEYPEENTEDLYIEIEEEGEIDG